MSLSNDLSIQLYQSVAEANTERFYKHWHASSIAICPRAHYFLRLGIPTLNKPTGGKVIRWGAGHKLEEELRPHIAKVWGGTTSNKRHTSKEWDLTGEYDNLILDGSRLVEVKSVSDWAFYKGPLTSDRVLKKDSGEKNKWNKPVYVPMDEPYLHHVLQNHAYVLLLAEQGHEVKFIDFVYVSLSGLICVYQTEVKPEYLEWVKKRLKMLNSAWDAQEPPQCNCDESSPLWGPVYQWCEFKEKGKEGCCDLSLITRENSK